MRTAPQDRNYLSIDTDNGNSVFYHDGEPAKPFSELEQPLNIWQRTEQPRWDDLLKVTGKVSSIVLFRPLIGQGSEACIDHNNGASFILYDRDMILGLRGERGEYTVKFKGGVHDISCNGKISVYSKVTICNVTIGEWSDQSTNPVYNVSGFIDKMQRDDNKPITVCFGRVTWHEFLTIRKLPNVRVLYGYSFLVFAQWWIKYFLIKSGMWAKLFKSY